jgi:CubicO group peptidase (beta-lactamase class C family)
MSQSPIEKLEPMIVDLMQEAKLPGLSIAVVVDGKSVYAKAFGARDLAENLPMTPETLYGIGSISKSFTAMVIMQLVEQGKINLNDPVSKHIDFKLGNEEKPITIHHLLAHNSGTPSLQGAVVAITRGLGDTNIAIPLSSREDFFHHINMAAAEVFDDPEKHFFYNNDMYTTLGLIIECITGVNF